MSGLTPYLIAELKTALNTYLQPWMRPSDAFDPLVNAYVNRGVLNKRNGSVIYGNQLADQNPVMGIMQYVNESTGATSLVLASTQNLYLYDPGSNTFNPLTSVVDSFFWFGTATGTITIDTFWPNQTPSSVSITDGTTTITDDGSGNFSSGGIFAAGGTINYTTGEVTLNFTGTTANTTLTITTSSSDYFTGNISNFFNSTNWQPTDPATFVSSVSYLYMLNNVDPLTLFDGTNLSRPILYVDSAQTDYITTALDVNVYKNRLLLFKPFLNSTSNPLNQSVYYSALFNPLNFINDVAGNGGQITAATGDIMQAAEFIRDSIIIFFSNSTWIFRYTGFDINPYRFDKINNTKNSSSPYGTVAYDERVTSIGNTGLIACDGSNVQRYDIPIVDYYEDNFNEEYYAQTFAQRYDNLNQSWHLYVSNGTSNPLIGGIAPGSDSALIYNFVENTWCTYTFTAQMTCLGIAIAQTGETWEASTFSWESADSAWDSYGNQAFAPILLAGDVNGNVYWMDNDNAVTDNGVSFLPNISTTRWNPNMQLGQKVQFSYIDIYYSIVSTDPANPIQLILSFFVDNSNTLASQQTLTLDGPTNSAVAWKRIYTNLVGEFIKMNIDPNEDAAFKILGFIIWTRPAGRLTP